MEVSLLVCCCCSLVLPFKKEGKLPVPETRWTSKQTPVVGRCFEQFAGKKHLSGPTHPRPPRDTDENEYMLWIYSTRSFRIRKAFTDSPDDS
ncbi:hypothetical protein TNCV_3037551 [Trichonephila clavipes]|nr:hypothetical protein TNCV_3037551 [Trichonephila clavipes]